MTAEHVILTVLVFIIGWRSIDAQTTETDLLSSSLLDDHEVLHDSNCTRTPYCCTVAVVSNKDPTVYVSMSETFQHTTSRVTVTGLDRFYMEFGIRGDHVNFLLSPTAPWIWHDLYYRLTFSTHEGPGHMRLDERLSLNEGDTAVSLFRPGFITPDHYTYYYVNITGDRLMVGKRGGPPLVNHTSTPLRRIKFLSFSRWFDKMGEAVYDCPIRSLTLNNTRYNEDLSIDVAEPTLSTTFYPTDMYTSVDALHGKGVKSSVGGLHRIDYIYYFSLFLTSFYCSFD